MNNRTYEREILTQALAAAKRMLPADIKIDAPRLPEPALRGDARIRIRGENETIELLAEIKARFPRAQRYFLYVQKEHLPQLLLITRHVNPIEAEEMKNQGLQFLDTVGNAYLNQKGLFVFVKGNKPPAQGAMEGKGQGFHTAGLKTTFLLLCEPHAIGAPYRQIAEAAGVALGTIGGLMRHLRENGFLVGEGAAGKLIRKRELFEKWVTGYVQKLKPKLALGRFKAPDEWWDRWQLDQGVWGGEVAAAKLTQYLQPEFATVYTARDDVHQLVIKHRLKKDAEGNLELVEKFWKRPEPFPGMAHPVVVYADLVAIGNQRDLETARVLYDRQIHRLIGED